MLSLLTRPEPKLLRLPEVPPDLVEADLAVAAAREKADIAAEVARDASARLMRAEGDAIRPRPLSEIADCKRRAAETFTRSTEAAAALRQARLQREPLLASYQSRAAAALGPAIDDAVASITAKLNEIDAGLQDLDRLHDEARQRGIVLSRKAPSGAGRLRSLLERYVVSFVTAWC